MRKGLCIHTGGSVAACTPVYMMYALAQIPTAMNPVTIQLPIFVRFILLSSAHGRTYLWNGQLISNNTDVLQAHTLPSIDSF